MLPIVREHLSQERKTKKKKKNRGIVSYCNSRSSWAGNYLKFFHPAAKVAGRINKVHTASSAADECVFNCCLDAVKTSVLSRIKHKLNRSYTQFSGYLLVCIHIYTHALQLYSQSFKIHTNHISNCCTTHRGRAHGCSSTY